MLCVCACVCVKCFRHPSNALPLARAKELRESLLSGTFLENYAAGFWHSRKMALFFFHSVQVVSSLFST